MLKANEEQAWFNNKSKIIVRDYWAISLIFMLAFLETSWLSIRRLLGLNSSWYDLGVITQSINSVLSGKLLEHSNNLTFLADSRLAGHVEVIYFFFAPLLLIYRSPITLLVAQSLLYATGGVAFFLIGKNLKDKKFGIWLAVFYLWYPVSQTAVLFDFHGDTIAMPLLAWALYAFTIRSWKLYIFLIIFALLCKSYVVVPVAIFGLILLKQGYKKQALFTLIFSISWGLIAVFFIKGFYSPAPLSNIQSYIAVRDISKTEDFFNLARLLTAIIIITPIFPYLKKGLLWFLPAFAIAIPAFFLQGYQYYYHHYAIAVPFIIYAIAQAYLKDNKKLSDKRGLAYLSLISCLLLNFIFVIYLDSSGFKLNNKPTHAPDRALHLIPWINQKIPANASITTSPNLSPFLSMRPQIFPTYTKDVQLDIEIDLNAAAKHSDYFVIDSFDENNTYALLDNEKDVLRWLTNAESEFNLLAARDGLFIFSKNKSEDIPWIDIPNDIPADNLNISMGNGLILDSSELEAKYTGKEWAFKTTYIWETASTPEISEIYASTNLEGYPVSRSLHIGSWVNHPVSEWQKGEIVREFVYLNLPHIPGCYPISVGWHDALPLVVAADTSTIQGERIIWGYWQMDEEVGEGELVEACIHK